LGSLGCPIGFWANLGPEKGAPGRKNENSPDIHPRNKCTKFQPNPTIFGLCRLPPSF